MRRRRAPKVDDVVVLIVLLTTIPAGVMLCALVYAIWRAWGAQIGA